MNGYFFVNADLILRYWGKCIIAILYFAANVNKLMETLMKTSNLFEIFLIRRSKEALLIKLFLSEKTNSSFMFVFFMDNPKHEFRRETILTSCVFVSAYISDTKVISG
jgi:hypothetical protein